MRFDEPLPLQVEMGKFQPMSSEIRMNRGDRKEQEARTTSGTTNRMQRIARALTAIWCFHLLVLNSLLQLIGFTSVYKYLAAFMLWIAARDSWEPIHHALQHYYTAPGEGIYRSIFFDEHVKFIYPPTSLVFLDPLYQLGDDMFFYRVLHALSWFSVLATSILVGNILVRTLDLTPEGVLAQDKKPLYRLWAVGTGFAITFYPLLRSFRAGQIQTCIDLLFVCVVLAWISEKKTLGGVLTALIVAVKPQLGLLFFWAIFRKEYRFAAGLAIAGGCILVLSCSLYGIQNHLDYLSVLSVLATHGESYFANQSLNGLLNRIYNTGVVTYWDGHNYPAFHPIVFSATLVSSIILVAIPFIAIWKDRVRKQHETLGRGTSLLDVSIATVCFTLASPITWDHHYGILLPLYVITVSMALRHIHALPRLFYGLLAGSFLLTANYFQFAESFVATMFSPLLSYGLFGGLLLLACLLFLRFRFVRDDSPAGVTFA